MFNAGEIEMFKKGGDSVSFIPIIAEGEPHCYLRMKEGEMLSQFVRRAHRFAQSMEERVPNELERNEGRDS